MRDRAKSRLNGRNRGYTLVEMMMVILIIMVVTAIAIPQVKSSLNRYRLEGAVASATWAIQSTRYQALMQGYQYQVVFTKSTNSYQIQSEPVGSSTFSNVGNSVPLSGASTVLNQDTTLTFKPNGYVSDPANLYYMTVTYQGMCQKIKVTNYANITLSTIGPTCS